MGQKQIYYIIISIMWLILLDCRQPDKKKVIEKIIIEPTWQGTCFQLDTGAPFPTLFIATLGEYNEKQWREFSIKIARMGYAVFIANAEGKFAGRNSISAYRTIVIDAIQFLRSQLTQKSPFILMGENQVGIACILAAVQDSSVAGVITLGTFFRDFQNEIQAALSIQPPKPLLVISSMDDLLVPQESIQKFYDEIKGPKKLVWLATSRHGAETLGTDMEPIVRRVTELFLEKYTKK